MKIALERLDLRALELSGPHTIKLREAAGVHGSADIEGERVTITGGGAERLLFDALEIHGETRISNRTGIVVDGAALSLEKIGERFSLDVSGSITATDLRIVVGDTIVEGVAKLHGAKIFVRDSEGTIAAERVELARFRVHTGGVEIAADVLGGNGLTIGWGASGFRLEVDAIETPAAKLQEVFFGDLAIGDLALGGNKLAIGSAIAQKIHTEIDLGQANRDAPSESSAPFDPQSIIDFAALDALGGDVDVDVEVDLAVPVIGHRRATHRLRVPIEHGAIDYRSLEDNLAKLEKALLDFSVREGALVLERVNPLFPSRGHGKPILFWPLSPSDLELANAERVRLAVLPDWQLVKGDEPDDDDRGKPGIALRRLDLRRIDVRLALAPVKLGRGHVRPAKIGSLIVQGNVFHGADGANEGALLGEAKEILLAVVDLPIGTSKLDIGAAAIAALSPIEVAFRDVRPVHVSVDAAGARLEKIVVRFAKVGP